MYVQYTVPALEALDPDFPLMSRSPVLLPPSARGRESTSETSARGAFSTSSACRCVMFAAVENETIRMKYSGRTFVAGILHTRNGNDEKEHYSVLTARLAINEQ